MSFGPFLGGKRICIGKTFAEIVTKVTTPLFVYYFDFEFVNEDLKVNRQQYNINMFKSPIIDCRVKEAAERAYRY